MQNEMSRRNFLGSVAAAALTPFVPIPTINPGVYRYFVANLPGEYGNTKIDGVELCDGDRIELRDCGPTPFPRTMTDLEKDMIALIKKNPIKMSASHPWASKSRS